MTFKKIISILSVGVMISTSACVAMAFTDYPKNKYVHPESNVVNVELKAPEIPELFCAHYSVDNFCTASADMISAQCSSRKARTEASAFSGEAYSVSMLQILLNSLVE